VKITGRGIIRFAVPIMKKLKKSEAIRLMSLVVDNEASEEEKVAFFKYIQTDKEVKKKYDSLLFIKQLLKTKYSPDGAPDHLKKKISGLIQDMEWENQQEAKVDNTPTHFQPSETFDSRDFRDNSSSKSSLFINFLKPARYLAAASVIFIFSLLTIEFLEVMSSDRLYNQRGLEYVALDHFKTGSHIEASVASFQPTSFDQASQLLRDQMSYSPRLPKIKGADLRSILETKFSSGHTVPVLDFYQAGIDESIHIFAFKLGEFEDPAMAARDPEAVENCKTYDDYHIKEINGKHVVSWKWGDYWYTAVSNHNGNDLIALVEPIGYPEDQISDGSGSSW
jgi:hypothetical protein